MYTHAKTTVMPTGRFVSHNIDLYNGNYRANSVCILYDTEKKTRFIETMWAPDSDLSTPEESDIQITNYRSVDELISSLGPANLPSGLKRWLRKVDSGIEKGIPYTLSTTFS